MKIKLKLTPRLAHVIVFLLSVGALVAQYEAGVISSGNPLSLTATWTALGASIWALFLHNILQPDDSTRNPGLMNTKLTPEVPAASGPPKSLHERLRHLGDWIQDFRARTRRPALFILNGLLAVCTTFLAVAFVQLTFGCKPAEEAIIQGVTQACTVLDAQPEPAWVYFTCAELDAAGAVIATYTVKVPKEAAARFTADHPATTVTMTSTSAEGGVR